MADKGIWSITTNNPDQKTQILYLNFGPAQGPLLVYRVHNDGPDAISVSPGPPGRHTPGVSINPGCDSDVSGSEIEVSFGVGRGARSASGTYELVCCQSLPQVAIPASSSPVARDKGQMKHVTLKKARYGPAA